MQVVSLTQAKFKLISTEGVLEQLRNKNAPKTLEFFVSQNREKNSEFCLAFFKIYIFQRGILRKPPL